MKHQFLITLNSHPTKQDIFWFLKMENGKKNVHETNFVINEIIFENLNFLQSSRSFNLKFMIQKFAYIL
jgi:hypothetical protein